MAYMNQEKKAKIVAAVKPVLKKYGVKGSFSVRNNLTICLTLTEGKIDFVEDYIRANGNKHYNVMTKDQVDYIRKNKTLDINPYWYQEHFSEPVKEFLDEVFSGMRAAGWYDNSDAQTDYFDTAYYVDVNVGKWNKPYAVC
jgi:hypothetical protein